MRSISLNIPKPVRLGRSPAVVCLMRTAADRGPTRRPRGKVAPAAAAVQLDYWRGRRSSDDDDVFERLESGGAIDLLTFATERLSLDARRLRDRIGRWAGAVIGTTFSSGSPAGPRHEATRAAIEASAERCSVVEHYREVADGTGTMSRLLSQSLILLALILSPYWNIWAPRGDQSRSGRALTRTMSTSASSSAGVIAGRRFGHFNRR